MLYAVQSVYLGGNFSEHTRGNQVSIPWDPIEASSGFGVLVIENHEGHSRNEGGVLAQPTVQFSEVLCPRDELTMQPCASFSGAESVRLRAAVTSPQRQGHG